MDIGTVRFPTGTIFACDPLVELEDARPYLQTIPAGSYPVQICVVPSKKYGDRYACVKVVVSKEKPVRYELGMVGTENLDEELEEDAYFGFGVDAGMGCIADRQTQEMFKAYWAKRLAEDEDIDPYNDLFCDLLEENFQMHPKYQRTCGDWLNWTVPESDCIEFEMLLAQAIQKGNNLAHHLIQSFAPGEATPEQAHEIGKQLADEVLQGKYSYVLTTHIDKGHVHNHLIFCAVDMVNHRKYNSNRQSYAYIRRTSDRLCREHGLSVVQPSRDKGKSYAEWDAGRKGKSWKAKLKAAIDAVIPQAKDFDDFLRLMAAQGYEIKQGKFISFRAPGQERFTRCKTLGENYTEEAITSRIKGLAVDRGPNRQHKGITLRIDLENNIKPSRARAMHVGRTPKFEAGRKFEFSQSPSALCCSPSRSAG